MHITFTRGQFSRGLLACALAALTSSAAWSATAVLAPLPAQLGQAKPVSVLPASPATSFTFTDNINPPQAPGSFKAVEVDGKLVFRADNPKGSSNYNGISARWSNTGAIRKGEVLFARFAARALKARQESGEAEGMFYFEKRGTEARTVQAFSVGPDWTVINVPIPATEDAAPGEVSISLSFGNLEQTLEIAGLDVLNFGDRIRLSDLPETKFTYAGREADAPWRKAALARIAQLRTAPLNIKVVDAAGKPVPGARVTAMLKQPAFLWGSEVNADQLVAKTADAERYREEVRKLFDTTVIGNGLKWPNYRNPASRARTLEALDWLTANGKRVKGHNLVWPAWKFSPTDIARDPQRGEKIAGLVDAHIRDITAATRGKLIGWDVVNEPIHETDYFKHMPREEVAKWFKLAEQSDPSLKLTLNEYSMLNRSSSPLFIAQFREFAEMLRKNGARVDVLGVQGHVGQTPRPPVAVLSDLDLLAAGGNQVQITEFDFNTKDEALQADYTRDFLIALYSHPATSGFIQWGFWQGAHWKPDAAMFRSDWSEKPNLQVWRDLVLTEWHTRIAQDSGARGDVAARGHFGNYVATAESQGKTTQATFTLTKDGADVVLTLK